MKTQNYSCCNTVSASTHQEFESINHVNEEWEKPGA